MSKMSKSKMSKEVRVGDVILLPLDHKDLPQLFKKAGMGEFVVVSACMEGGGGNPYDRYPDGWHVTAVLLVDGKFYENSPEVSFYQSGAFWGSIPQVEVVRKMKKKVTFE